MTSDLDGSAQQDAPPIYPPPPGCDPAKDPKDSLPCVADTYGLFVDATKGLDTNDGTKAKPLKSIGAAIAKATTTKRIYVCEGTYAASAAITLDAAHDGIGIYGGWSCADWSYTGTKPKTSTASGYVLRIDALTSGATIEDLEFDAHGTSRLERPFSERRGRG